MKARSRFRPSTTARSGSSDPTAEFDSPAPTTGDLAVLVAAQDADIGITPSTAVTRWTGEALDLDLAIGWLMQKANYAKSVSAETSKSVGP